LRVILAEDAEDHRPLAAHLHSRFHEDAGRGELFGDGTPRRAAFGFPDRLAVQVESHHRSVPRLLVFELDFRFGLGDRRIAETAGQPRAPAAPLTGGTGRGQRSAINTRAGPGPKRKVNHLERVAHAREPPAATSEILRARLTGS